MKNKEISIKEMVIKANIAYLDGKTFKDRWNKEDITNTDLIRDIFINNKNKYYVDKFEDGILSIKSKINDYPITEKLLLFLGFEREDVSAEESGDKPYFYFVYNLKNERAILISCANDECKDNTDSDVYDHIDYDSRCNNYTVEFFNEEDAGYIDNANVLESLVSALKCLKSK
jgi:hypothetical protein